YHASSLLLLIIRPPPVPTLFPYTTLFRSRVRAERALRSRMSPRSASFGSAFATCGSRTTTFVASVTRRAYFPRARRPKSERLYSRRRLSDRFLLAFLIDLPLACGRGSATLGVGDHEKTTAGRDTEGD